MLADDAALVAHCAKDLQILLDRLAASCAAFGLMISVSKTVVMCQGAVEDQVAPIEVSVSNKKLEVVNEFCYLGSCISSRANMEADLDRLIARASICFGQLRKRVWENRKLRLKTKIAVYTSCVLSTLLYGSETWSVYAAQITRLNTFHLRNLRRILGINWMDRVSNAEVLHRTQCDPYDAQTSLVWTFMSYASESSTEEGLVQ